MSQARNLADLLNSSGLITNTKLADSTITNAKLATPGIGAPDYDNKATRSAATDYQASENGYLLVLWSGSYRNGGQIFLGPNTSSYTSFHANGNDLNNNSWYAAGMVVVPNGYYYKFTVDGVFAQGWETVTGYWIPEA